MKLSFSTIRELFPRNRENAHKVNIQIWGSDEAAYLQQILDEYLLSAKPFLRHRYSLRELAQETGIAVHQLSAYLNKQRGINFNDFINQYRINFCLHFLENTAIKKVNLVELGGMCGFNNRSSFTTSFKKITGNTPSAYIRNFDSMTRERN
jgi:AraC-like DNA-binding protein